MRLLRRLLIVVAVLVAVVVAAFLWIRHGPREVPQGQQPLATLSGSKLQLLRDEFNAHTGRVRILALLSPT